MVFLEAGGLLLLLQTKEAERCVLQSLVKYYYTIEMILVHFHGPTVRGADVL